MVFECVCVCVCVLERQAAAVRGRQPGSFRHCSVTYYLPMLQLPQLLLHLVQADSEERAPVHDQISHLQWRTQCED